MMAFLPQSHFRSAFLRGTVTAVGSLGLLGEDLEDCTATGRLHHPP